MGNPMGRSVETYHGPKGPVTLMVTLPKRSTSADPHGNREQRRRWAKQHGKPMPRLTEGIDAEHDSGSDNSAA